MRLPLACFHLAASGRNLEEQTDRRPKCAKSIFHYGHLGERYVLDGHPKRAFADLPTCRCPRPWQMAASYSQSEAIPKCKGRAPQGGRHRRLKRSLINPRSVGKRDQLQKRFLMSDDAAASASPSPSASASAAAPAEEESSERSRPNVLVTGTPGVGKTATASLIAERLGMQHLSVGDIVKQHKFYEGRDEKYDTLILDEDRLLDHMEQMLAEAAEEGRGVVVDYHGCDFFPERWFDLVLVLRAKTDVLYDRLIERKYNETKRNENMECEIMQVILDEAKESYAEEIVHEVQSNTLDDMESNVTRVEQWTKQWIKDNEQ